MYNVRIYIVCKYKCIIYMCTYAGKSFVYMTEV